MKALFFLLLPCLLAYRTSATDNFKNLNFDAPDLSGVPVSNDRPQGTADVDKILPGWKLYYGTNAVTAMNVNSDSTDTDDASLVDWRENPAFVEGSVPGSYTGFALRLQTVGENSQFWSLEQAGHIPAGSKYLTYRVSEARAMQVELNGETIPLLASTSAVGSASNLVYDISAFADRDATLRLTGPIYPGDPVGGTPRPFLMRIDTLQFLGAEEPRISITRTGDQIVLRWAASLGSFFPQIASDLLPGSWGLVWQPPTQTNDEYTVTVDKEAAPTFFRLGVTSINQ